MSWRRTVAEWMRRTAVLLDPPTPSMRIELAPSACFRCGGPIANGVTHACPDGLWQVTLTTDISTSTFYEDDEPLDGILLAFERGHKGLTAR